MFASSYQSFKVIISSSLETAKFVVYIVPYLLAALSITYLLVSLYLKKVNRPFKTKKSNIIEILISSVNLPLIAGFVVYGYKLIIGTIIETPLNIEQWSQIIILVEAIFILIIAYNIMMQINNLLGLIIRFARVTKYLTILLLVSINILMKVDSSYVVLVLGVVFSICLVENIFKDFEYKKVEEDDLNEERVIDKPVEEFKDLFESRKIQVNNIINILDHTPENEPFAAMIRGKWGVGKTSLLNGVKSKLSERNKDIKKNRQKGYEFITISAGYSQNTEEVLNEIEKQMMEILNADHFYYGPDETIHSYFQIMCDFAGVVSKDYPNVFRGTLEKITDRKETSQKSAAERINKVLRGYSRKTNKKIVIIIDDLERSTNLCAKNLFSTIMETTRLEGCITIVSCDYEHLIENIDAKYLDKYFERTYTIASTSFGMMLAEYPKQLYICRDDDIVLSDEIRSINNASAYIVELLQYYDKFLQILIEPYKLVAGWDNDKYKLYGTEKVQQLKNGEYEEFIRKESYLERFNNPRLYRRMWNVGIKEKVQQILSIYVYDSSVIEQWNVNNWPKVVAAVVILEYIIPELYDNFIRGNEIYDNNWSKASVMEEDNLKRSLICQVIINESLSDDEKKACNWIIFDINKLGYIQADYKSITEEWLNDELNVKHLEKYILLYGNNNENLLKIYKYINKNIKSIIDAGEKGVIGNVYNAYDNYFKVDDNSLELLQEINNNLGMIRMLDASYVEEGYRSGLEYYVQQQSGVYLTAVDICNEDIAKAIWTIDELPEVEIWFDDNESCEEEYAKLKEYIRDTFMPRLEELRTQKIHKLCTVHDMIYIFKKAYEKVDRFLKEAGIPNFLNKEDYDKYYYSINKIKTGRGIIDLILQYIAIVDSSSKLEEHESNEVV